MKLTPVFGLVLGAAILSVSLLPQLGGQTSDAAKPVAPKAYQPRATRGRRVDWRFNTRFRSTSEGEWDGNADSIFDFSNSFMLAPQS